LPPELFATPEAPGGCATLHTGGIADSRTPRRPQLRRASVIAHFGDGPALVYQLVQWLPVLEILDREQPVTVVLRDPETAVLVRERTSLPVLLAQEFAALVELYDQLGAAVALYCNNSPTNFDSLLDTRMLHVHVNHGESDKKSMASNNVKSYDRVFVAGQAAVDRYAAAVLELDTDRLVRTGRPQLDLARPRVLPPSPRRTVLYAPTWEDDAAYNNYSSVDTIGPRIVQHLLDVTDVRVVYKPHPRVVLSTDPGIRAGHRTIVKLVARAAAREPRAGHTSLLDADILAVMPSCDAMVTDVSSVGLDWLYLRTDRPLFITDRHEDEEQLRTAAPVSRCADVVDSRNVGDLTHLMTAQLEHDELYLARVAMRRYYFDDAGVGDSTTRFLAAVGELVVLREALVRALPMNPFALPRLAEHGNTRFDPS
jgi:CDP-glycerol:poly(glycerophosphate) glycerophosphotransferase